MITPKVLFGRGTRLSVLILPACLAIGSAALADSKGGSLRTQGATLDEGLVIRLDVASKPDSIDFKRRYGPVLDYYRSQRDFQSFNHRIQVTVPVLGGQLAGHGLGFIGNLNPMIKPVAGGFGMFLSEVKKEADGQFTRQLSGMLRDYLIEREDRDAGLKNFEAIYNSDPREAVDELLGIGTSDISDPSERQELIEAAIRELARQIQAAKTEFANGTRRTREDIEKLKKDTVALKARTKSLEELQKKGKAVEKGYDDHLKEAVEKPMSVEPMSQQAQLQRMASYSRIFAAEMEAFSTLAAALKNPKLAEAAARASQIGQVAAVVFSLLPTPNPLQILPALAGVTSLLGGGGPDPIQVELERQHKEVMARLDEIEATIKRNQIELIRSLGNINVGLAEALVGIKEVLARNANVCANGLGSSDNLSVQTLWNAAQIEALASTARQWSLPKCLDGLLELFPRQDGSAFSNVFLMEKFADAALLAGRVAPPDQERARQIMDYMKDWNAKVYAFARSNLSDAYVYSMAIPALNAATTHKKMMLLGNIVKDPERMEVRDVYDPLDPVAVLRYVGYLVALHNWYEWIDAKGDFVLGKQKNYNNAGRITLGVAHKLLNAAIAQQSLLSGEALTPVAFAILTGRSPAGKISGSLSMADALRADSQFKKEPAAARQSVLDMLKANSLFAKNMGTYLAWAGLTIDQQSTDDLGLVRGGRGLNLIGYHMATSTSDSYLLKKILNLDVDLVFDAAAKKNDATGWFAVIGDVRIPLPTTDEILEHGRFYSSADLGQLVDLRDQVVTEMTNYEVGAASHPFVEELRRLSGSGLAVQ